MMRPRWVGPVLVGLFVAGAVLLTGLPQAGRDAVVRLFEGVAPAPRIVNGTLTSLYPSTGALLVGNAPETASSWCSGVLIGQRTFLTAAHCVCEGNGGDCQGRNAPSQNGRIVFLQHAGFFDVASIHVHPDFRFPINDLAVIRLTAPVTGVTPTPLMTEQPQAGDQGTIAGFGRTGGSRADFGLKRVGSIVVAPCRNGLSDVTSLCWNFDGGGANTCNGDSGGPLFMDVGSGMMVAGITSGGLRDDCLAGDLAYDTNVYHYRDWVLSVAGDDVGTGSYGAIPPVGDPRTTVLSASGTLSETGPTDIHTIEVPEGTNELRIALDGLDADGANFDLYVRADRAPTTREYDCYAGGEGQYGYCEFLFPDAGTWYVLARREAGAGPYQLTTTLVGGDPPVCGNQAIETGEDCDGAADDGCPGLCDSDCTCPPQCIDGALVKLRGRIGPRLLVKAVLLNRGGDYDHLDPRTSDFALTFNDGPEPVEIVIPAGDPGWTIIDGQATTFVWQGSFDNRRVTLRCRKLRSGNWHITLKGRREVSPQ
jgi:Trypsin/Bacterial pre-peptidase C-terminal domain